MDARREPSNGDAKSFGSTFVLTRCFLFPESSASGGFCFQMTRLTLVDGKSETSKRRATEDEYTIWILGIACSKRTQTGCALLFLYCSCERYTKSSSSLNLRLPHRTI